jgi:hypothetical protein
VVRYDEVENLALTAEGRAKYKALCLGEARMTDVERAEKLLYEIVVRMWKIPADKVDESFYSTFVAAKDAYEVYYRAKRFEMMNTQLVPTHRQNLKQKLEAIMALEDANIQLYKTRLKQHYGKLIAGQTLMTMLLTRDQREALVRDGSVTIDDQAVANAYVRFKETLDAGELRAALKMFELTDTTGDFIAVRKIAALAFSINVQRHSKRSNLAAYHIVHVDIGFLSKTHKAYSPALLAEVLPSQPIP